MRFAMFMAVALLSMQMVLGIGVSPAQLEFTQHYDEMEFEFRVLGTNAPVSVRAEGSLAEYIDLDNTTVRPGERVTGRITALPDLAPGTYGNRIIVRELSGNAAGTVAATAEIAAQLLVHVPRPDAYLAAVWEYERQGEQLRFTVMLENLGTREVKPDDLRIVLADEQVPLDRPVVRPASMEKVTARHAPDLAPGVYDAVLHVAHGNRSFEDAKRIVFGSPRIVIDELVYHAEETGVVKPVDIAGTIQWNRPVDIEIQIFADNGTGPVAGTVVSTQDKFDERLYLEGLDPGMLRAVVRALDARAESVWEPVPADSAKWPWIAAIVLILLGVAWLWYLRE